MANIIKSPYARVVTTTKPIIMGDIGDDKPKKKDEAISPVEVNKTNEEELKRAYDELIIAAQEEVALIFEDARRTAEEIKANAHAEIEATKTEIYEQTYAEAYDRGYTEGTEAAMEQVTSVLEEAEREANKLMEQAYRERDSLLDGCERQILELVLKIAGKILKMELERSDPAYLSMVTNALGSIKSEKHVTLRVNPGDYVRHFKSHEAVLNTVNGSITANVINDSTMPYYGCLIETEGGAVDAGADAQLERTAQALGVLE